MPLETTSNPTNKDQEAGICHTSQGQVAGTCKIDNIVLEITHSTSTYALCAWLKLDALCFAVVAFLCRDKESNHSDDLSPSKTFFCFIF